MLKLRALLLAPALIAISFAQDAPQPVLDVTSMDKTADPCVDFYTYACGNWMKKNPIPPDESSWSAYSKLQDENLLRLRGILETAANPSPDRGPVQQKIGDYYASCMDETAVEDAGIQPLQKPLEEINSLGSKTISPGLSRTWPTRAPCLTSVRSRISATPPR
jgi:putative endopeptidase